MGFNYKLFVGQLLTMATTTTAASVSDTDSTVVKGVSESAKLISEYGVGVVACAVLIIFAIMMFGVIIKKFTGSSDVELLTAIKSELENIKKEMESESSAAEVFDRLNNKITDGITSLKRGENDITDDIKEIVEEVEKLRKVVDQQNNLIMQMNQKLNEMYL